jgi:hypothetical protein
MQPIQLREDREQLDLYRIDTGDFKDAPIAFIISEMGQLAVFKSSEDGKDVEGEPLFYSTDWEACMHYIVGMAYIWVANKIA